MRTFGIVVGTVCLAALAGCQQTMPRTYNQITCTDRAYGAGLCDQDTNFRLFTPEGPQHDGRRW